MHLVIGAVASALLARRKSVGPAGALNFWGVLEVAHELPGRIRLRCPSLQGAAGDAARLAKELPRLPGVRKVAADPRSGSVLIAYEPERIDVHTVQAGVLKLLGLETRIERPAPSLLTRQTDELVDALNRAILDLSRGVADLDFLIPTILMTAATVHLARKSGASLPAGITLLWWALAYMAGRRGSP